MALESAAHRRIVSREGKSISMTREKQSWAAPAEEGNVIRRVRAGEKKSSAAKKAKVFAFGLRKKGRAANRARAVDGKAGS